MTQTVTSKLIDEMYELCFQELTKLTTSQASEEENTLKLGAAPLIPVLAWQVLVPFLIGLTSKVVADEISYERIKRKTVSELKAEASRTEGKVVDLNNLDKNEEFVLLVEDLLKPLGVNRQQIREIVQVLSRNISNSK